MTLQCASMFVMRLVCVIIPPLLVALMLLPLKRISRPQIHLSNGVISQFPKAYEKVVQTAHSGCMEEINCLDNEPSSFRNIKLLQSC